MSSNKDLSVAELGKLYPITIEKYNSGWKQEYLKEIGSLKSLLNPKIALRFEHFGSTAIPGLSAKPVIDILVEISSFEDAKEKFVALLENNAYLYMWQPKSERSAGHMMFVKGYGSTGYLEGIQRIHLHMATKGHNFWEGLYFRDYLRAHPEACQEYEHLKNQLALKHQYDREAYTESKGEFILSITEKAKKML
jgi:GrpB-like predicted nucleotidyltransferase (UPF0157 family)